jgi:hypothetical protein
MTALRKQKHDGLPVAYADDFSEDQVRKMDESVREKFRDDDWVTVEQES